MRPKKKPKTKEEIKEQKRIAERLRYQRLKNDPVKREQLKEKERRNYQRKKEKGTRKLVKDMCRREHKAVTKEWRKHRAKNHEKKSFERNNKQFCTTKYSGIRGFSFSSIPMTTPRNDASNARKRHARKKRDKIIKYKDKKIEKRLERLEKAKTKENVDTPNTKLIKMCDSPVTRSEVVKKALFGELLNAQLKENYANLKTCQEKQIFGKVRYYDRWREQVPKLRTRKEKISSDCIKTVRTFYENDDNSRLGAGKRECLTRKGVKKQKRYLSDSIANLYKKFQAEHFKISYTTFCRLRPFWVITPNVSERDKCLSIKHANIDLKLHTALLEKTCCNRYDELCLSRTCQRCIDKNPNYSEFDDSKPIEFKKWISEKQTYKDPKTKNVRAVTKYLKKTFTRWARNSIQKQNDVLHPGINTSTRESGHGKGAPDRIGATCKKTADAVVATGGDIDSLESFVEAIQQRCSAITLLTIDDKAIQELTDDLQNETVNLKSLSCTCEDECQHFNLGVLEYKNKTKLNVDDIYTDSENENIDNLQDPTMETDDDAALAGPSSINQQNYTIGDYVLVKFLVRNTEYCYAAVINKIDMEEGELTVTFLKICDDKGHTFRVDENDVSDVSFDQVLKKLPNPDIALKGKRIFYYFNIPVPVFEK
ncbi:hypothetical protein HW555_002086 [Spodoptera exigua]|uniref:Uncharacterized protein n=1 Tax=Spodoptera exigua TaxID=7107 RepID=A0A835GNP2_SPOEX|nr:hypothetical protein HW555_002086 [Spodoptera exigua]